MAQSGNKESSQQNRNDFRIKVCGMTLPEQVHALNDMQVDFAGFIFYPPSPRFVKDRLLPAELKSIRGNIKKVGVFVDTPYDEVMRTVEDYGLDMVQLHGNETPLFCEKVAKHTTVIKAFRPVADGKLKELLRSFNDVADMFLFDTPGDAYGGTGQKFDWSVLQEASIGKKFFLSGGIKPGDETAIREFAATPGAQKMFAIDINSRFETNPGIKDMQRIKDFITSCRL